METMDRKPITEILAENLATAMAESGLLNVSCGTLKILLDVHLKF